MRGDGLASNAAAVLFVIVDGSPRTAVNLPVCGRRRELTTKQSVTHRHVEACNAVAEASMPLCVLTHTLALTIRGDALLCT